MIFEKNKKKYIAVFVVKQQDVRVVLRKKRFKPTSEMIRFRKRTFPIDVAYPTYAKGLKLYYFVDIKDGQVLLNETTNESIINPEILDIILSRKIVTQLTSNLAGNETKMKLVDIFLGLIMGIFGTLGVLYLMGGNFSG